MGRFDGDQYENNATYTTATEKSTMETINSQMQLQAFIYHFLFTMVKMNREKLNQIKNINILIQSNECTMNSVTSKQKYFEMKKRTQKNNE